MPRVGAVAFEVSFTCQPPPPPPPLTDSHLRPSPKATRKAEWILAIKPSVWAVLASVCGGDACALRTECCHVALKSAAYIEMRLRAARVLPWSLVGGPTSDKLQVLKSQEKPSDLVAGKIWELMRLDIRCSVRGRRQATRRRPMGCGRSRGRTCFNDHDDAPAHVP